MEAVKVLDGVLERTGPGEVQDGWCSREYIDIGGQRVSTVLLSNGMGYHLDNALGKNVRLALAGRKGVGGIVAAIEVDGRVRSLIAEAKTLLDR